VAYSKLMTRLFTIIGLIISNCTFGQYIVNGIVYDNNRKPFPGVNVIEYMSDASTVTDAKGKFSIKCFKPQPTLILSFIGYKTKEILADTSKFIETTLEMDESVSSDDFILDIFYYRYTKIGLSSGINYTPMGLRIDNFTPEVLGIWTMLSSGVDWRTNNSNNNKYIDVFLRRMEILRIRNSKISLFGQYKAFRTSQAELTELNFSPDLTLRRLRISVGYTYQERLKSEFRSSGHGTHLGLSIYLFDPLSIDFKTIYVLDSFQYDYRLVWNFNTPKITLGFGYQKLGQLNELRTSIRLLNKVIKSFHNGVGGRQDIKYLFYYVC
jgi:hypothetical protein